MSTHTRRDDEVQSDTPMEHSDSDSDSDSSLATSDSESDSEFESPSELEAGSRFNPSPSPSFPLPAAPTQDTPTSIRDTVSYRRIDIESPISLPEPDSIATVESGGSPLPQRPADSQDIPQNQPPRMHMLSTIYKRNPKTGKEKFVPNFVADKDKIQVQCKSPNDGCKGECLFTRSLLVLENERKANLYIRCNLADCSWSRSKKLRSFYHITGTYSYSKSDRQKIYERYQKKHLYAIHTRPFRCPLPLCKYSVCGFSQSSSLERHLTKLDSHPPIPRAACDSGTRKSAKRKPVVLDSLRVDTEDHDDPLARGRENAKRTKTIHEFLCPDEDCATGRNIAGNGFSRNDNLIMHRRTMHSKDAEEVQQPLKRGRKPIPVPTDIQRARAEIKSTYYCPVAGCRSFEKFSNSASVNIPPPQTTSSRQALQKLQSHFREAHASSALGGDTSFESVSVVYMTTDDRLAIALELLSKPEVLKPATIPDGFKFRCPFAECNDEDDVDKGSFETEFGLYSHRWKFHREHTLQYSDAKREMYEAAEE